MALQEPDLRLSRPPAGPGLLARLAARLRPAPTPTPETQAEAEAPAPSAGFRLRRQWRAKRDLRREAPAWLVSLLVHAVILTSLGLATLAPEARRAVANLNAALVDTTVPDVEELLKPMVDPSSDPRALATAPLTTEPGLGSELTSASAPSDSPMVAMRPDISERGHLPSTNVIDRLSGPTIKPPSNELVKDIGGGRGGGVAGDPAFPIETIGDALDQLALEILGHLQHHKLTVIWMFDESLSMKDERLAIKDKFDRVVNELELREDQEHPDALLHAIVGFGNTIHFSQEKPTADITLIGKAIDRLPTDETGIENTLLATRAVINRYAGQISRERRLLLVIATDESGDDGKTELEQTLVTARNLRVPIYVIGRQSMFGTSVLRLPYKDPITQNVYWPTIDRGPETAGLENLQYDGLHGRWDEQPAGFAPYDLARLTKDTGGIYFLLPNEEELRRKEKRLEKLFSMSTLKEYVPDYDRREVYDQRVAQSPLRRSLDEIIKRTSGYGFRKHYSIDPPTLIAQVNAELPKVAEQLAFLIAIETRLGALEKERNREPEKRWQAAYDLMLGQIVAYQIKAYEYRATILDMSRKAGRGELRPENKPMPGRRIVDWDIHHARTGKAPTEETEAKRARATYLLELVIERHPDTPWADLARIELDRGFGCGLGEWARDPRYDERAGIVPKF